MNADVHIYLFYFYHFVELESMLTFFQLSDALVSSPLTFLLTSFLSLPLLSENPLFPPLCIDCLSVPQCKMRFPYLIAATNHTLRIYRGTRSSLTLLAHDSPSHALSTR